MGPNGPLVPNLPLSELLFQYNLLNCSSTWLIYLFEVTTLVLSFFNCAISLVEINIYRILGNSNATGVSSCDTALGLALLLHLVNSKFSFLFEVCISSPRGIRLNHELTIESDECHQPFSLGRLN